jgi:hypothetical protein
LILPAGDRGTDPDPRAVLGRGICVVTYDDRVRSPSCRIGGAVELVEHVHHLGAEPAKFLSVCSR